MVVLTIVTQKNRETVYFDKPLPKVHFMKLLSCSLYNSWDMLKNESTISLVENDNSLKNTNILPGHYTLENLVKTIEEAFKKIIYEISVDTYSAVGQLVITNHGLKPIRISPNLANLLNIGGDLKNLVIFIKCLIRVTPTAYFIHCDLLDRNNNLLNGKRSDLLAKFDVRGEPYEKVRYDTVLLKGKLTVPQSSILETRFSILDSRKL